MAMWTEAVWLRWKRRWIVVLKGLGQTWSAVADTIAGVLDAGFRLRFWGVSGREGGQSRRDGFVRDKWAVFQCRADDRLVVGPNGVGDAIDYTADAVD